MNPPLASVIVSFLAPMLVLMILTGALMRSTTLKPRGVGWCVGSGLVSLGILMIPVADVPMARAFAGIVDHWSVPMLALLVAAVAKLYFGMELFRPADQGALWIFGVVTGLVLYPMALGWGAADPFALGWRFGPLIVLVGMIALILQWRGNRFGIVLVLSFGAWLVGIAESGNVWDCLIDPIFFVVAVVSGIRFLMGNRGGNPR